MNHGNRKDVWWNSMMRVIVVIFLIPVLSIGCSQRISDVAERKASENDKDNARGFFVRPTWSRDNSVLFFGEQTKDFKKIRIWKYDLLASKATTVYAGPSVASLAINDCNEVFAPTFDDPKSDFCMISSKGKRFYNLRSVKFMLFPTWLSDCSEVVFEGARWYIPGVFLWNKNSNALKRITPFPFKTKDSKGVRVYYTYATFAASFVPRRMIFGYHELQVHDGKGASTDYLGAMDIETGKAWKIIELTNSSEQFRWHSSETEDAIYFFKWNESGPLDSLWKVKSDGTGMSKVLDGKEMGELEWQFTVVSWSRGGEKIALKYRRYPEKRDRIDIVNTLTGQVSNLELGVNPIFSAISPDGRKLAYVTSENEVYLLDIESNIKEKIFPAGHDKELKQNNIYKCGCLSGLIV